MHRANSVRHVDHYAQQQQQQTQPPPLYSHQDHMRGSGPAIQRRLDEQGALEMPTATNPHKQQQQAQDQAALKSYFSDGDFSEVLIRVTNDQDEHQAAGRKEATTSLAGDEQASPSRQSGSPYDKRRRSSCSDAGDSKRSSLSRD